MIRAIRLRNFKCFREMSVPMGALTMLAGRNSSGKSSVLHAILLLRQSHLQRLLSTGHLALNGDLAALGTGKDALFVDAETETIGIGLTWDDTATDWEFDYTPDKRVLSQAPALQPPAVPLEKAPFIDSFQILLADRLGPQHFYKMRTAAALRERDLGPRGEYVAQFLEDHAWVDYDNSKLAHPQAVSALWKDHVEAWLVELGLADRLHVEEQSAVDVISLAFQRAGVVNRPTNFGFGVSCALPVVVALLALRQDGILLLENPEIHLHPAAQQAMGYLCARAAAGGGQVVVETHSDHVLNGVRLAVKEGILAPDECVLNYFSSDGIEAHRETPTINDNGRVSSWPAGFFDEWEKALARLVR